MTKQSGGFMYVCARRSTAPLKDIGVIDSTAPMTSRSGVIICTTVIVTRVSDLEKFTNP